MRRLFLPLVLIAAAAPLAAQTANPAMLAEQRAALAKLGRLDGVWRGEAVTKTPGGEHRVVHTERAGGFLDGTIKLIEGHAYNPDGSTGFHAFGVISYDTTSKAYVFRSHAQGYAGTFPLTVTDTGYVWEIPAGPGARLRYTATISGDRWNEVGDRIVGDAAPQRVFEMNLKRVGATDWPQAGAIPMR